MSVGLYRIGCIQHLFEIFHQYKYTTSMRDAWYGLHYPVRKNRKGSRHLRHCVVKTGPDLTPFTGSQVSSLLSVAVTTIHKVAFGFPLRHRIAAAAVAEKYRSYKIWKMEDACNGCVSWEEEMYWSHFQCKHFIQYLHTGFDQQLAIPEKFARNLKKKLGDTLSLKGPSGNTWSVGITAHNDTLFFNHGWPEFVKDHNLEESDILIFKYNGVSHFDVLMFNGGSQCEKASSYFVRKCGRTDHGSGSQTKRKFREGSVEVIPTASDCDVEGTPSEKTANNDIDKIRGKPVVSVSSKKRFYTGDSSARAVHTRHTVRRKPLFTSAEEVEEKPDIEHITFNGNGASSPHHTSNGRLVTEDQKRNAFHLAQATLTTDSFLIVMRPTHVYKKFYMSIPNAWITRYLMGESQDIILRTSEKTWNTRFLFWKPRSCGGISSGWKNFALDNNLDEFDVCVFSPERLEIKPIVLNVSIFRVVNEVVPLTQVAMSP